VHSLRKYYNSVWNSPTFMTWGSFITKSLSFFLVLPFVLKTFNVVDINLWYFLTAIINMQIILDGGFGSSFVRVIAYSVKDSYVTSHILNKENVDMDMLVRIYNYMNRIYKRIFVISFLILASGGSYMIYNKIQLSSSPANGWMLWIFLCFSFPVVLFGNIYINFLQGIHKVALVRRWDTIFNLLNVGSSLLVLFLFKDIYVLFFSTLIWMMINVLRNRFLVTQLFLSKFNIQTINNGEEDKELSKLIVSNAIKSGIGLLMSQGIIQMSGFFLNSSFSQVEIGYYMLGINVIQPIRNFSQAPFYSKIPQFSSYAGNNNMDKLKKESKKSMQLVYVLFSIGFFLVAFFNEDILKLIGSNVVFPDERLWYLMGLAFLIDRFGGMHLQLYSTSNHIIWHKLNGITGVIIIIVTYILLPYTKLCSFPLAMLIGYTSCYSTFSAIKSYKYMNESFLNFEKKVFVPILSIFILYGFYIFFK
jgi:O-antigen/teichoic acid export membrane protein